MYRCSLCQFGSYLLSEKICRNHSLYLVKKYYALKEVKIMYEFEELTDDTKRIVIENCSPYLGECYPVAESIDDEMDKEEVA